jgi:hypothetical protein
MMRPSLSPAAEVDNPTINRRRLIARSTVRRAGATELVSLIFFRHVLITN